MNKGANKTARKNEVEKRLDKMEKYLADVMNTINKVAEDSDNLRFLISLIRVQEGTAKQMKQHLTMQDNFIEMAGEFIESEELKPKFEEFVQKKHRKCKMCHGPVEDDDQQEDKTYLCPKCIEMISKKVPACFGTFGIADNCDSDCKVLEACIEQTKVEKCPEEPPAPPEEESE